ncbi:MAG TPA: hypothetical protein PKW90_24435, partial [Myxococcota bacterium]|nr:hypothetical protein [Myxococcota bacterium]
MRTVWATLTPADREALLRLAGFAALDGIGLSTVVLLSNLILQDDSEAARVVGGAPNVFVVLGLGLLNYRIIPRHAGVVVDRIAEWRVRMADRLRATDLRTQQVNPELVGAMAVDFGEVDELPDTVVTLGFMSASVVGSTLVVGVLSTAGLVVWLAIVAAIVLHHRRTRAELGQVGPVLAAARRQLGAALRLRLHGHAQLQHDSVARTEDLNRLLRLEQGAAGAQDRLNDARGQALAWGEDVLLLGLGVVVFRLPALAGLTSAAQYELTTTLLSMSGMTLVLVGLLLQCRLIAGAAERLQEMEHRLA